MKIAFRYITTGLALIGVAAGLASCNKSFLEIEPKGKLIARSVADYDMLFNNTSLINTTASAGGVNAQVAMSDEVVTAEPFFSAQTLRTQRLLRWDAVVYEPDQDAQELGSIMPQLYTYNKIINEVPEAEDGTQEAKDVLVAEARANRAWCYQTLINFYGKPYNAATASNDEGFPIVKEADVAATKFSRASVQQVYDFIVEDLTAAIPLLPVNQPLRVRMCRSAAEAILAKTYLFMGEYDKARQQLENAFSHMPTTFVTALYDLNITMAPGGWGYNASTNPTSYQSLVPTAWVNTENLFPKQTGAQGWNADNASVLMSKAAADLFTPNDQRRKFFSSQRYGGGSLGAPGALRRNSGTQIQIGVRLAEMYLMLAECRARNNDLEGAKTALETVRLKRMPDGEARIGTVTQSRMIQLVVQERLLEFALQGQRWFDIRRLWNDPLFDFKNITHKHYDENGNLIHEYRMPEERLVMRFPQKAINENPGMNNNP